jgi:hypothetical protein
MRPPADTKAPPSARHVDAKHRACIADRSRHHNDHEIPGPLCARFGWLECTLTGEHRRATPRENRAHEYVNGPFILWGEVFHHGGCNLQEPQLSALAPMGARHRPWPHHWSRPLRRRCGLHLGCGAFAVFGTHQLRNAMAGAPASRTRQAHGELAL